MIPGWLDAFKTAREVLDPDSVRAAFPTFGGSSGFSEGRDRAAVPEAGRGVERDSDGAVSARVVRSSGCIEPGRAEARWSGALFFVFCAWVRAGVGGTSPPADARSDLAWSAPEP